MTLRSVHMNKHEKKNPGSLLYSPAAARVTKVHSPCIWSSVKYQIVKVLTSCVTFYSIGAKSSYMEYTSLAAEPDTRCFIYWPVPNGHFFYLWDKTSSVLPYSSREENRDRAQAHPEWVGSTETFRNKLHRRESWPILNVLFTLHVSLEVWFTLAITSLSVLSLERKYWMESTLGINMSANTTGHLINGCFPQHIVIHTECPLVVFGNH